VLARQGQYADALAALRRGHELGSKQPGWRHPSEQWVKECVPLAALEERLQKILAGTGKPTDGPDAMRLAELCTLRKQYAGAVKLYGEALRLKPEWLSRNVDGYRYKAALFAAKAGCGQGVDVARMSDAERARLRQQALTWLRQELDLWSRISNRKEVRPAVRSALDKWKSHPDLRGVRDEVELKKLPAEERSAWQNLWADVAALRQRTDDPLPPKTAPPAPKKMS
jgi:hypothetical protein